MPQNCPAGRQGGGPDTSSHGLSPRAPTGGLPLGLISGFCRPLSEFPWCGESKRRQLQGLGWNAGSRGRPCPGAAQRAEGFQPRPGVGGAGALAPTSTRNCACPCSVSPGGLCRLLGEVRPVSGLPPLCWHPNSALGCATLDCPPTASVRCPLSSSRHGVHKDKGWGSPGLSTWQELCEPGLLA